MKHQNDLTKLRRLQIRIRARKGLIGCGEEFSVALHRSGCLMYAGTDRWGQEQSRRWTDTLLIACGKDHMVSLTEEGGVRVAGRRIADPAFLSHLTGVRTVAAGERNIAVLLGNGSVLVGGDDSSGQCRTANWPTVTDIVCGRNFTVGLTEAGTLAVAGGSRPFRYFLRSWRNIAGIFTDYSGKHVYAITLDGGLVSTAPLPLTVQRWEKLVFVAASARGIWGVTSTGQLLSTDPLSVRMNSTRLYVSCAVSNGHAVALTRDGEVLAAGNNAYGQCATSKFVELFEGFDEFSAIRRGKLDMMDTVEHEYQIRLAETTRYRRLLACGQRLTACINADGRVLASVGYPGSLQWTKVKSLACGNAHLLALHEDGHVSADGNDVDGCTAVSDWTQVKAVAAGKYHSFGLREDGGVLFCGRNDCGQGDVSRWTRIKRLYARDTYTVGVTWDGDILVAGAPPFDVAMLDHTWKHPVDVAVSGTHMVCLYENGLVRDTAELSVAGGHMGTARWRNVRAIAAGEGCTVGLCYGGRVLTAGEGARLTADWRRVVDVGCGHGYIAGLTSEGRVLIAAEHAPHGLREALQWRDVLSLCCGPRHLVGVTRGGQVLACGEDGDKQCASAAHFALFRDIRQLYGYGRYDRQLEGEILLSRTSAPVEPDTPTVRVLTHAAAKGRFAVGMAHTLCLTDTNRILAEGANDCGQCDLRSGEAVSYVAAGPYRSAAILPNGHLLMTGRNSLGQSDAQKLNRELETVDKTCRYEWKQVACGMAHTVALRSDGRVYAIGSNPDGRCDTRQWREVTYVACGVRNTVACKADGSCLATGDNRYGQCEISHWRGVVSVAVGEYHTVALTADGHVLAAGDDRMGQCDLRDLENIVAVACLPEATLCLRADGRVILRGGSGELNQAVDALRGIVALDTCEYRIAAMTVDGQLLLLP